MSAAARAWTRIQESWLLFWYRIHRALFVSDLKRAEWCARLGAFYARTSRHDRGTDYFTKSLHLMRKSLRPGHPRLTWPLVGMVNALYAQERYQDSLEPTRELVALCMSALGPEHPHSLVT